MNLSVLTFSMMQDVRQHRLNAGMLCLIARKNGLFTLDLMDREVSLYGEKRLKAALKRTGIRCGCLITTIPLYTFPRRAQASVLTALEQAESLGAPYLMIVPGLPLAFENRALRKKTRQQIMDETIAFYQMAVDKAKACGITVCLENTPHAMKPLSSAEDCLYLLEHVDGLRLVYDTANMLIADTNADILAFYKKLKPYIVRVHVKDVVIGNFKIGEECVDHQKIIAVPTGSGVLPIRDVLQHLKADCFSGDLAIEYAAAPDVHGAGHAKALQLYCEYIRNCLAEAND